MKALTLIQPMAHAIVALPSHLAKNLENRIWSPPDSLLGQRFAIHAGLAWGAARFPWPTDVPRIARSECEFGCVVGVATLLGWFLAKPGQDLCYGLAPKTLDAVHDQAVFIRLIGLPATRWWLGPVGWLLGKVQRLPEPILCRGYQKLWNLPKEIESQVLEQLGSTVEAVDGSTPIEEAEAGAGDKALRGGARR